jgi:hypothetical protein
MREVLFGMLAALTITAATAEEDMGPCYARPNRGGAMRTIVGVLVWLWLRWWEPVVGFVLLLVLRAYLTFVGLLLFMIFLVWIVDGLSLVFPETFAWVKR